MRNYLNSVIRPHARFLWCVGFMACMVVAQTQSRQTVTSPPQTVLFICEHGAAKSVIAAAYFNKFAAERHLNYVAIARGTAPQAELSESTVAGLRRDRIAFPNEKPQGLTDRDARNAARVVAFCVVPKRISNHAGFKSYEVPAPKDG